MYDAFTADLEKDNAAEAEAQKSFEEIMATKRQELATLEATLQKQDNRCISASCISWHEAATSSMQCLIPGLGYVQTHSVMNTRQDRGSYTAKVF